MYKATFDRSGEYLVHFNKNHSSKNGQFTSGDGDGDGVVGDHKHRRKLQNKLNDSLKRAEIARYEYIKSQKHQRVKNPYKESGYSDFIIYDNRKKIKLEKRVEETEKIIKKITDAGYTVDGYDSFIFYPETYEGGKKFVETSINNEKIRLEWK